MKDKALQNLVKTKY